MVDVPTSSARRRRVRPELPSTAIRRAAVSMRAVRTDASAVLGLTLDSIAYRRYRYDISPLWNVAIGGPTMKATDTGDTGQRYLEGNYGPVREERTDTELPVTGSIPEHLDGR